MPERKKKRADLMIGNEFSKLLNLIQLKPYRTSRAESPFVLHLRRPRVATSSVDLQPYGSNSNKSLPLLSQKKVKRRAKSARIL